jgi:hypothetical protein
MFFGRSFQKEFFRMNPTKELPVKLNDVIFSVHGVFITTVMVIQCIFYERGGQTISSVGRYIVTAVYAPAVVLLFFYFNGCVDKLMLISFFSFVKVGLAVFKYTPQVSRSFITV